MQIYILCKLAVFPKDSHAEPGIRSIAKSN